MGDGGGGSIMTDEGDSNNEDLDFLGNGSMKDILLRMGDIDKVIAEITDMEDEPRKSSASGTGSDIKRGSHQDDTSDPNEHKENTESVDGKNRIIPSSLTYDDSTASIISDTDVYADNYGNGVANLQGELQKFEESQRQAATEEREHGQPENIVSLVAQGTNQRPFRRSVSVSIVKPTPDSVVGISMKSSKGVTRIISLLENGLLVDTALDAGMELVEVNGISVTSARHARFLIQSAQDEVTFVAIEVSIAEL
jgi:hypothetical protein